MTINTPVKIIAAIVAIGVIALLFWLFDWQAKTEKIKAHEAQLVELQQKLDEMNEMVRDLPVLTKQKADLEAKLANIVKQNLVPEKAEMFVANYIKEIEKLTEEERERMGDPTFEIISITPGVLTQTTASTESSDEEGKEEAAEDSSTPDALKQFPTRMFQMSMRGRYTTLIDFLYQLGALRLERLVTINKIALSPVGDQKEPGVVPTLQISIPITAYMRQGG